MIEFIKNVSALSKIIPNGVISVEISPVMKTKEIHLQESKFREICKNPEIEYLSGIHDKLYFEHGGILVFCLVERKSEPEEEKRALYEVLKAEFEGENE